MFPFFLFTTISICRLNKEMQFLTRICHLLQEISNGLKRFLTDFRCFGQTLHLSIICKQLGFPGNTIPMTQAIFIQSGELFILVLIALFNIGWSLARLVERDLFLWFGICLIGLRTSCISVLGLFFLFTFPFHPKYADNFCYCFSFLQ